MARGQHKSPQVTRHGKRQQSTNKTMKRIFNNTQVLKKLKDALQ